MGQLDKAVEFPSFFGVEEETRPSFSFRFHFLINVMDIHGTSQSIETIEMQGGGCHEGGGLARARG